jgi:hypothetical protein
MRAWSARPRRIRAGTLALAATLALLLAVAPPTARTVLGAEDLRTAATTTYTLDPAAGRVHVAIDVTETDLKPNSAQYEYFYLSFRFALQPAATNVRVSGGTADRISTVRHDKYVEATVHLSHALFYRKSTSFTIRYDLLGGKPRSTTPTRAGEAFATFAVWAWGDQGRGVVEVRTPNGYDTRYVGDEMQATSSATTGTILRARPANPASFFSIVTAENGRAYTETPLSLAGGVDIVVQSWPEDERWKTTVTETLRDAMPELRSLIGLDWPVAHALGVRERYTPDLEGYAGFFLTAEQRIEVGEDLDQNVIVHEASHAWFNDSLFLERWIYEGLAEEYAWRALVAVDRDAGSAAEKPDLSDPGYLDLEAWTHPGVIDDQETDDRERYGYQAAYWVIHTLTEAVGVDRMREAFRRADASLTAYPGADAPEIVVNGDSWRRLVDLAEPLDGPDPANVDQVLRDYVLGPGDEAALSKRTSARAAYRALVAAGDGWLPGWYVRGRMGDWEFDKATARMAEATAILALRDEVLVAAAAIGLQPDGALRTAYVQAKDGLADARTLAQAQLDAIAAITAAKAKVEATADLIAQVGLLGETPVTAYDAARAAFEAGNLADANALAATATSVIDGAPAAGQQRLVLAGLSIGGAVLVLLVTLALMRRRRRGRLALAAVAASTLAADPAPEPPPTDATPPDPEGGQSPG